MSTLKSEPGSASFERKRTAEKRLNMERRSAASGARRLQKSGAARLRKKSRVVTDRKLN